MVDDSAIGLIVRPSCVLCVWCLRSVGYGLGMRKISAFKCQNFERLQICHCSSVMNCSREGIGLDNRGYIALKKGRVDRDWICS